MVEKKYAKARGKFAEGEKLEPAVGTELNLDRWLSGH